MTRIHRFNPPGQAFPGMSQAVVVDGWILVSGQVALDADGRVVGEGDAERQAEQIFRNMEQVLAMAGADLSDVIRLTCFLASDAAYAGYAAAKNRLFELCPPASSVVVVDALLLPDLLLEVEATAWLPPERHPAAPA